MDSEEFSLTASKRRAMKRKEKKKRKQAVKGTPAARSLTHPAPSAEEEENEGIYNENT